MKESKSNITKAGVSIMSIINASPDSFAVSQPTLSEQLRCAECALAQGADIIDIGGCSTRPGSVAVCEEEEWSRIEPFLREFRQKHSDVMLSVDTFRSRIAQRAIENYNVDIINDVSGGEDEMYEVIARCGGTYVLTFAERVGKDDIIQAANEWFEKKITYLTDLGIINLILDLGFGFNKSFEQNWQLLNHLAKLKRFGLPVLVGLSRKSMIQKAINENASDSLVGTAAAHLVALQNGADILRVHDIKAARNVIDIYNLTK